MAAFFISNKQLDYNMQVSFSSNRCLPFTYFQTTSSYLRFIRQLLNYPLVFIRKVLSLKSQ